MQPRCEPYRKPIDGHVGSRTWVRARLHLLASSVDDGAERPASHELIDWLQAVVLHPPRQEQRLGSQGIRDIAQDAIVSILEALQTSRAEFARADNPAALLERIAARACAQACHRARMHGLGRLAERTDGTGGSALAITSRRGQGDVDLREPALSRVPARYRHRGRGAARGPMDHQPSRRDA